MGWGFCYIRNNQGLGKYNQTRPPASADYTCLDLDYSGYHKNLIQLLFVIIGTSNIVVPLPLKDQKSANSVRKRNAKSERKNWSANQACLSV